MPDEVWPPTQWSLVDRLKNGDEAQRDEARRELCEMYVKPIITQFERLHRHGNPDAVDRAQSFMVKKFLGEKVIFDRADPDRGKLRALLIRSATNYYRDELRRESRRPGAGANAIDAHDGDSADPCPAADPERIDWQLNLAWWSVILERTLRLCEVSAERKGRSVQWQAFYRWKVLPALDRAQAPTQSRLAEDLGLHDASKVADAVHAMTRDFRKIFYEVVFDTVGEETSARAEVEDLLRAIVAHGPGRASSLLGDPGRPASVEDEVPAEAVGVA